jgi:hypothetical protein
MIGDLIKSDLTSAGCETLIGTITGWLTVSLAHFGIGVIVGAMLIFGGLQVRWFWIFMALILVKEVAGDLPLAGWALLIVADSIWDLLCYAVGFFTLWGLAMNDDGRA